MILAAVLLGAVTAERLAELWLARRNTADLLAKGAREFAPSHYPAIVLLHAFWLAGLWIFGWTHPLSSLWLMIFLVLQAMRVWILMTLGDRWTTRIVVLPDAPLVTTGPYRFLSHPNYFVVIGEIAASHSASACPGCSDLFRLECNRSSGPRPGRECGIDWIAPLISIELCSTIRAVCAETWSVFDLVAH
jgi:methyltransferase